MIAIIFSWNWRILCLICSTLKILIMRNWMIPLLPSCDSKLGSGSPWSGSFLLGWWFRLLFLTQPKIGAKSQSTFESSDPLLTIYIWSIFGRDKQSWYHINVPSLWSNDALNSTPLTIATTSKGETAFYKQSQQPLLWTFSKTCLSFDTKEACKRDFPCIH